MYDEASRERSKKANFKLRTSLQLVGNFTY